MDELAHAAGLDPVEFRLQHLQDQRAIDVINTGRGAAMKARELRVAEADAETGHEAGHESRAYGQGMAFARYKNTKCYAAVFVDVMVNTETSEIKLIHAVISADAGQVIDPDGLSNQLEGGFIQSASWTLKEQVTYDENGITSRDWDTYPILTFPEIPTVDVILLDHPEEPSLGSGEATQGPTSAAIANAVFDATGQRLRDVPFTPDKLVVAALKSR
jgi:CO/xanthine dehydrogenase Mo-binding subunit